VRLLAVPNWSEGRDADTLAQMRSALRTHGATVHFDEADEDHNRIVTAFSGEAEIVRDTLFAVAKVALERIDMRSHEGVHPRIGALDVCPFIVLEGNLQDALDFANEIASELARNYAIPIFLYEHSETGKHASDLPSLRRGQFEGLTGRELNADHGPSHANPKLGATVLGVRDWLIAMNVNLAEGRLTEARAIAGEMRVQRDMGDSRFAGVRALGLPLNRRRLTQVSMNLTKPNEVTPDKIIDWIDQRENVVETQLIGVIRELDLPGATRLPIRQEQIVRVDS
jgi:glutamate formiminotransferase